MEVAIPLCRIMSFRSSAVSIRVRSPRLHRLNIPVHAPRSPLRTLLTREGEISVGRTSSSNLRRELSRVRRDFILSTTNRSEQQSALLGGRRKNFTSGQRVRASRSSNDGSIGGDRSTNNAWDTGMGSASTDATGRGVSRLEASVLQEPRGGVSWDDVFISKVEATSSATLGASGNDFTRIGKSADWRLRRAPETGKAGASGCDGARCQLSFGGTNNIVHYNRYVVLLIVW